MLNWKIKTDIGFILLIIYLILSPIYWLPGVDYMIIKYFKILLILIILLYFFIDTKWEFITPKIFQAPLIIILFWFVPFLLITTKTNDILQLTIFYSNYFFGILAGIMAYNRYVQIVTNKNIFKYVLIGVSILCLFPISNFYFGIPAWISPFAIENGTERLDVFWSTSFHGSRTGWSIVLSEFVPFTLLFIFSDNKKTLELKHLIIILLLLTPIIGAQIICMGRGGLLGSVISIFIILFRMFSKKILISFVGLLIFLVFSYNDYISIALRISTQDGEKLSLKEVSSSRSILIKQAPELILNSLVLGNGYKGSVISGVFFKSDIKNLEIHNVFIRIFVDHGVIFGTIILIFVTQIILTCIKILRLKDSPIIMIIACCIIISGVVSANFEPNTIFGNFQNLPLWWISVGLIIFYKNNLLNKKSKYFRN